MYIRTYNILSTTKQYFLYESNQMENRKSQKMSNKNSTCAASNKIEKFQTLDAKVQNLIREAVEARNFSYSPYSNFKVGACLLCADGTLYRGCNIENRSFTVGICAERCAYAKAISEGKMNFKAIAVIAQQEQFFTTPCGACRQFMSEYGNVDVYMAKPNGEDVFVTTLDELLPHQFKTVDNTFV